MLKSTDGEIKTLDCLHMKSVVPEASLHIACAYQSQCQKGRKYIDNDIPLSLQHTGEFACNKLVSIEWISNYIPW